jgi:hypothetical protein
MLRSLSIALILAANLPAASVFPEVWGEFKRASEGAATPPGDPDVWKEYGFDFGARAQYGSPAKTFVVVGYRMNDSTGAFAAFQALRPQEARKSDLAPLAAEAGDHLVLAYGNYVFYLQGHKPGAEDLQRLYLTLPRFEQSPLPAFAGFLPSENRIPNTERYVGGPEALEQIEPKIPPSAAAFRYGTEAQFARYNTAAGEMQLGLFSYPTPHIARERAEEFTQIAGAMVKRSGPLVAVIVAPRNRDEAERLLAEVRYEAEVTRNERVPAVNENPGSMLIAIFALAGLLILGSLFAGFLFGGIRILKRRSHGTERAEDPMIMLHLSDR